jgi:hypothetical protein
MNLVHMSSMIPKRVLHVAFIGPVFLHLSDIQGQSGEKRALSSIASKPKSAYSKSIHQERQSNDCPATESSPYRETAVLRIDGA